MRISVLFVSAVLLCAGFMTVAGCDDGGGSGDNDWEGPTGGNGAYDDWDGGNGDCPIGTRGCDCTEGGGCDPGLECVAGTCIDPDNCPVGSKGCACTAGGSCDTGLTCVNNVCIEQNNDYDAGVICGSGDHQISGTFKTGVSSINFDRVSVNLQHKRDVDEYEDGCITAVDMRFYFSEGCQLHVVGSDYLVAPGQLKITQIEFMADSLCPNFPDQSEGRYTDEGGLSTAKVVPGVMEVPGYNVPTACVDTNIRINLNGRLNRDTDDVTLAVSLVEITVTGEFGSIGDLSRSCPCQQNCAGKECGDDGCGGTCGVCESGGECRDGKCCECSANDETRTQCVGDNLNVCDDGCSYTFHLCNQICIEGGYSSSDYCDFDSGNGNDVCWCAE